MKRIILVYSLSLAALIMALKLLEYRYFVQRLSLEIYLGTVAVLFTAFGVWAGLRLTRPKPVIVTQVVQAITSSSP